MQKKLNKIVKASQELREAERNTTSSKGTRAVQKPIKEGAPADHATRHFPTSPNIVGMNKGITKNMENYESFRVDVWMTTEVREGETIQDALDRISEIIDIQLESEVESVME